MQLIKSIRNAVRKAVGLPPIREPQKLLEIPTELQQRMAPFSRAPQWFRLLMLYRIMKRDYAKRRTGNSAKSPEVLARHRRQAKAGKPCSHVRLGRATGPNSYDEWKAECAASRAQRKAALH
jgi:hypothetical protein